MKKFHCDSAPGELIILFYRKNHIAGKFFDLPNISGPEGYLMILERMTENLDLLGISSSSEYYEAYLVNVGEGEESAKISLIQSDYYRFLIGFFSDGETRYDVFPETLQDAWKYWNYMNLYISRNSYYTISSPTFAGTFSPNNPLYTGMINNSSLTTHSPRTVALLDTGIDSSLGFTIGNSKNLLSKMHYYYSDGEDDNGHGTQMAQIIEYMSPKTKFNVYKVCDASGNLKEWSFLSALFCCSNDDSSIINMSLEQGITKDRDCGNCGLVLSQVRSATLEEKISDVFSKNKILIASAGNESLNELKYPAKVEEVIAICSIDSKSELSDFSNFGTDTYKTIGNVTSPHKYVFAAPGGNRSPLETVFTANKGYGTSHAAAYASGALSVLWGNNFTWTNDDVLTNLLSTYSRVIHTRKGDRRQIEI